MRRQVATIAWAVVMLLGVRGAQASRMRADHSSARSSLRSHVPDGTVPMAPVCSSEPDIACVDTWFHTSAVSKICDDGSTRLVVGAIAGRPGSGSVSFDRASDFYIDAGPQTLNISTNGGFTAVARVRFAGAVGDGEKIFTLLKDNGDSIELGRYMSYQVLIFQMMSQRLPTQVNGDYFYDPGTVGTFNTDATTIVQDQWMTVIARYNCETEAMEIWVNGELIQSGFAISDVLTGSQTFQSISVGQAPFNGDIAGLFVVDKYLEIEEAMTVANGMIEGHATGHPCEEKSLNCYLYCEGTGPSSTAACASSALASEMHSVTCGPSYTACMRISITQNGESLFLGSCGYENASDTILHLGMNVTLVEECTTDNCNQHRVAPSCEIGHGEAWAESQKSCVGSAYLSTGEVASMRDTTPPVRSQKLRTGGVEQLLSGPSTKLSLPPLGSKAPPSNEVEYRHWVDGGWISSVCSGPCNGREPWMCDEAKGQYFCAEASLAQITDNDLAYYKYFYIAAKDGARTCQTKTWIQMDLGSLAHVSRIRRWLYYGDGRSYCNQAVVLSATGAFAGEEETVWQCSDYEDCGPEMTEEAGFEGNLTGKVIRFPSRPARYIRYYAGRNNVNAETHFTEVQVFGTWDMESSTQMVDPTRSGAEVYASGWTLTSENQKYRLELAANGDLVVRDRDTKAPAIWKLGSSGENCNAVCLSLGSSYHCDRETTATGASSHEDFLSILTQVAPGNVSDPAQQDGGAGGPGWISGDAPFLDVNFPNSLFYCGDGRDCAASTTKCESSKSTRARLCACRDWSDSPLSLSGDGKVVWQNLGNSSAMLIGGSRASNGAYLPLSEATRGKVLHAAGEARAYQEHFTGCVGRNELGNYTTSLGFCQYLCDSWPDCTSFEFNSVHSKCQVSSSCTIVTSDDPSCTYSGAPGCSDEWRLYEKAPRVFIELTNTGQLWRRYDSGFEALINPEVPGDQQGSYQLVLQNDGNLVIYDSTTAELALSLLGMSLNCSFANGDMDCPVGTFCNFKKQGCEPCFACPYDETGSVISSTCRARCASVPSRPGICLDVAGWSDAYGNGCDTYDVAKCAQTWYMAPIESAGMSMKSALQKCCTCGGGVRQTWSSGFSDGTLLDASKALQASGYCGASCSNCSIGSQDDETSDVCLLCDVGKYGLLPGEPCRLCPANSTTATFGSLSLTDCLCNKGFYFNGAGCSSCPANSTTATVGSSSIRDCLCDEDLYFNGASCSSCPNGSATQGNGSVAVTECLCAKGSFLAWGYNETIADLGNETTCSPYAPDGAKQGQCRLDGLCDSCRKSCAYECGPGLVPSFARCEICPPDTYVRPEVNGSLADGCAQCPFGSTSARGSPFRENCTCMERFTGPAGGPCAVICDSERILRLYHESFIPSSSTAVESSNSSSQKCTWHLAKFYEDFARDNDCRHVQGAAYLCARELSHSSASNVGEYRAIGSSTESLREDLVRIEPSDARTEETIREAEWRDFLASAHKAKRKKVRKKDRPSRSRTGRKKR